MDGYCLTVYDIGDKRISNMNMCTRKEASAERVYKVMMRIDSSFKCSTPLHRSSCLNYLTIHSSKFVASMTS